jgi:hypothetical protein
MEQKAVRNEFLCPKKTSFWPKNKESYSMPKWLAKVSISQPFMSDDGHILRATELLDSTKPVFDFIQLLGQAVREMQLDVEPEVEKLFWPSQTLQRQLAMSEIVRSAELTPSEVRVLANCLQHFWADPLFSDSLGLYCCDILQSPDYANVVAKQNRSTHDAVSAHFTEKLIVAFDKMALNDRRSVIKVFETAEQVHSQFMAVARRRREMEPHPSSTARGPVPLPMVVGAVETHTSRAQDGDVLAGVSVRNTSQSSMPLRDAERDAAGRRGRRRGGQGPRAAAAPADLTARAATFRCFNCGGVGHKRATCSSPPQVNSKPSSYALLVGAQRDEPQVHTSLTTHMYVTSTASITLRRSVLLDTGAPTSAISAELAYALRTNMLPQAQDVTYTGVGGAAIDVIGTVEHVLLARAAGGAPDLHLRNVLVVRGLQWPVIVGLADISRHKTLHVQFTPQEAVVTLGVGTPLRVPRQASGGPRTAVATIRQSTVGAPEIAASDEPRFVLATACPTSLAGEAGAGPQAALASIQLSPAVAPGNESREEPSLTVVSQMAHVAERALAQSDKDERAKAQPVPASFSPNIKPKPEISYHSEEETAYRKAFHAVHAEAYKKVEVNASLSPATRASLSTLLAASAPAFAVKTPGQKPPVMNTELAETWPLQLMIRPGVPTRSMTSAPFRTTRELITLAAEQELLVRTRRAVLARSAFAIAPAMVADKGRIVHAHIDSNKLCMGSAHPMPNTERQCAAMAAFQGSYFFQSDILEAFSQWPLAQGSGVAACIGINGKILQPMVAPMGVSAVPATFNHLISSLFSIRTDDFLVMTYCDDIIGVARTEAGLVKLTEHVTAVAARVGITLAAHKTVIGSESVEYLGAKVSCGKVEASPAYIELIRGLGRPTTVAELMSFRGCCTWLARHLVRAHAALSVLTDFETRSGSKSTRLKWTAKTAAAYDEVIARLADPAVLVPFDSARTLFVVTDASDLGASVIFMQLHPDPRTGAPTLRVVSATALKFSSAELGYSTAEKELAALRHAHARFEHLMLGRTTVWLSDCASMAQLLAGTSITKKRRLLATLLDLMGTSIYSVHIAGRHNQLADFLSRNPAFRDMPAVDDRAPFTSVSVPIAALSADSAAFAVHNLALELEALAALSDDEPETATTAVATTTVLAAVTPAPLPRVAEATPRAVELALQRVQTKTPSLLASVLELQESDDSLEAVRAAAKSGAIVDNMRFTLVPVGAARALFAFDAAQSANPHRRLLLVIPQGLRQSTIDALHALTGCGTATRMVNRARNMIYWPQFIRDVHRFARHCDACARARTARLAGANFGNSELTPMAKPTVPGQVWQMDSWVLPQLGDGGDGVRMIGALDVFSGFVRFFRVDDATAASAAAVLQQLRDAYGPQLSAVYTDPGTEFKGEFTRLASQLGIHHHVGSVGNHTSAARIERAFRMVNDFVAKAFTHAAARGRSQLASADIVLSGAAEAINTMPQVDAEKLGIAPTPFQRFHGFAPIMSQRAALVSIGATAEDDEDELSYVTYLQFLALVANSQILAEQSVPAAPDVEGRERARAVREAQSAAAARLAHGAPIQARVGDLVFLNSPFAPRGKISSRVRARLGPYRVEEVVLQNGDQPLKVRLRLCVPIVGMRDESLTVFVRELTPCGQLPALDPLGSLFPPTGFLVADLDVERSQQALHQLQTIYEQGLSIEERERVRARRAQSVAQVPPAQGGRRSEAAGVVSAGPARQPQRWFDSDDESQSDEQSEPSFDGSTESRDSDSGVEVSSDDSNLSNESESDSSVSLSWSGRDDDDVDDKVPPDEALGGGPPAGDRLPPSSPDLDSIDGFVVEQHRVGPLVGTPVVDRSQAVVEPERPRSLYQRVEGRFRRLVRILDALSPKRK